MKELIRRIKERIWGPRANKLEINKYVVYMEPRSDIFIKKIIEYRG